MDTLSARYSLKTLRMPPTTGHSDAEYKPKHRLAVFLVIAFALCSIIAGIWALMYPACDSVVSLYVKIVTIYYAFEAVICIIRFPIGNFAKRAREISKTR